MVIETLSNWEQLFEQLRRMQAAGLVDGFTLEFLSPNGKPSPTKPSIYSFSSRTELEFMAEGLPTVMPPFRSFAIENGGTEEVRGKSYRILQVTASL